MTDVGAVAVIPARGGSRRVPRKNIREMHGRPLLAYSIEAALSSGLFAGIVVSTDDAEIATVARAEGTFHLPGRTGREIDWTHAIDIDTEEDWRLADALMGRS